MRPLLPACFAVLVGCGGAEPPPAPAEPAPPVVEAPPPEPDGFPAAAGEAIRALAAGGRVARCPVGATAEEELTAGAYRAEGGAFVAVHDGWVVLAANEPTGIAWLWRGADPVAAVRWVGASSDGWGKCYPARAATFEVAGRVVDAQGEAVEGVVVGGCLVGHTARSDAEGRFRLNGLPEQGCGLYAGKDDGTALFPAGPIAVDSQGEDVLVEVVMGDSIDGQRRDDWYASLPRVAALRARAAANALDLRRRQIPSLSGDAAALATGWVDAVAAALDAAAADTPDPGADRAAAALASLGG